MQIKATLSQNSQDQKKQKHKQMTTNAGKGCGDRGMLILYWWECKLMQLLWKSAWRFLKKTKNRSARSFGYTVFGHISKVLYIFYRDTCSFMIIAACFIISRKWKQLFCLSVDEWMAKMCYIYTRILLLRKMKIPGLWMGLITVMLHELTHTEKDKHCTSSIISGS